MIKYANFRRQLQITVHLSVLPSFRLLFSLTVVE